MVGGAEAALDALLGRLVDGAFVLTDGHGAVSKWGEPAELLFGRDAPDVLGRSFFDTLIATPLAPAGEGWRRFLAAGDPPGAPGKVDLHAQHANGHPFVVELVFVPVRLEEGFDFSLFLEDLGFELEPAQMLARLRAQHPVVIRALRAALAEEPQVWDPAWRVSGTLVVLRPLVETPWVEAERQRREQAVADAAAPAEAGTGEAIAGYADAGQIIERLLGAVQRLDALEITAAELPNALEAATARAEAAEREARTARAELEEQRSAHAETVRRIEAGHGRLRAHEERLAQMERDQAQASAGAGGEAGDLRALIGGLQERLDALAARLDGFQAGFDEARQAALSARREAEAAREAATTAGTVTARSAQKLSSAWQELLAPRDAGDNIRVLPSREPAPAPPERPRRAGFDDATAPMALLALDGHFREINPVFSVLVGYPEHEFTKAVWPSAHDRGDYREQCDQLRRMRTGELESVGIRSTYMHGMGLMVPVRGELALVRDAEGRPEHLLLRAEERSSH